jgi:hypothetical protein
VAKGARANGRGERKDKVCCYHDIQLRGKKQSLEVPAAAEGACASGRVWRMWKIEVQYKHRFTKWILKMKPVFLKYLDLNYSYSIMIFRHNATKAV